MLDAGAMYSRFEISSSNAASFIWIPITPDSTRPGTRGSRREVGIDQSPWDEEKLEIGRKPIANPKSEISNWTDRSAARRSNLRFRICNGLSSNFKILV